MNARKELFVSVMAAAARTCGADTIANVKEINFT